MPDLSSYTDTTVTNGVPVCHEISAVNAVGEGPRSNEASASPMAPLDTTEPTVAITFPSGGATLMSTSVTVAGTASDDVAVEKVQVDMDGTNWVLATDTSSWSAGLALVEGADTIHARATNTSGNTATESIAVTVDIASPDLAPSLVLALVGGVVAVSAVVAAVLLCRRRGK